LEAFVWTFWLAAITMALVTVAAIVIGSLAAFRVGGVFDRLATFFSLTGRTQCQKVPVPDVGRTCSLTAKMTIATMASQKSGA
ncbi:hypothetical protein AB9F35_35485, partial [Rhizobium leguminosarum]